MDAFDAALKQVGGRPDAGAAKVDPLDAALASFAPARSMKFGVTRAAQPVMPVATAGASSIDREDGPGVVESFARGAAQTATFGFADEIAGAFGSIVGPKTYSQVRDESRANFKAAEEANPIASIAGSLAGGIIPVPGIAGAGLARAAMSVAKTGSNVAKAAKLAQTAMQSQTVGAAILRGAAMGGLAGAGAAEDGVLSGALSGAAIGGALGGVISGVTKKLAGKVPTKIIENATDGSKARLRDNVANLDQKQGTVFKVVMEPEAKELRNALGLQGTGFVKGKDPARVAEEANDLIGKFSGRNDEAYKVFNEATGGVDIKKLSDEIRKISKAHLESPQTAEQADRLEVILEKMQRTWGKDSTGFNGVKKPAREVREFVTKIQNSADFATIDPTAAQQIKREVAGNMKEAFDRTLVGQAIEDSVGQMAKRFGGGGNTVQDRLSKPLKKILEDNERIHALSTIRDAANFAGQRANTNSPRIGKIASGVMDLGLVGTGNFAGLGLKKAAETILPRASNAASMGAYRLIEAAKAGQPVGVLAKLAIENGLPVAAAQKAFDSFGAAANGE